MCTTQHNTGLRYRFSLLTQELRGAETYEYAACVLAFINCIISGSDDISKRVKLRNELIGMIMCIFPKIILLTYLFIHLALDLQAILTPWRYG